MAFGGGGGSSAIGTSTDVFMSDKAQNDILVYNAQTVKWNNKPLIGTVALANSGGAENLDTVDASSGTAAIDLANGNVFDVSLTGATTLSFTGAQEGKACSFSLYLRQDGTGSRTVTWPNTVKWSGGEPTISTGANAIDILVFESIDGGGTWFGSLVGTNFS